MQFLFAEIGKKRQSLEYTIRLMWIIKRLIVLIIFYIDWFVDGIVYNLLWFVYAYNSILIEWITSNKNISYLDIINTSDTKKEIQIQKDSLLEWLV